MYAKTAEEQVRRWDAGETIWTVEMGGLGPGYEQAIQVCAIEITRDWLGKPLPDEKDTEAWGRFQDEFGESTLKRIDDELGGLSGAMFGAAKYLAYRWLTVGPEEAIEPYSQDRRTQCSKRWVGVGD